ncbi:MAG: BlaI/MecI/CopY family transcriptional regulator [FCB group bacterium]|nr:BlaI/MecI/CopY family transcriptional regulator [FCB group bacterium]
MAQKRKLTPAEWEIMEIIWELGGSPSVRNVLENRYRDGKKAYTTVQTIMNHLYEKGMLNRKKIGLVNFYTPVVPRHLLVKTEVSTIVSRIFDGSVPALANYLIDSENLSLEEINDIKNLLDKKEQQLLGQDND